MNVHNDEYIPISITQWASEVIKEGLFIELKGNIKVDYVPWTAVGFIEPKCDGIKEDNFYGKTEGFLVGTSHS